MELTLENLVNEIVKQESDYRFEMIYAKNVLGINSSKFNYWYSKWFVLHNLAVKFNFEDKLKR